MSKKVSPKNLALADQVIATLNVHGPMTTKEIAQCLPPRVYFKCGHNDCDRPEHRITYQKSMYMGDAYQLLSGMHRRGQIERTPMDGSTSTMWWVKS